MSKSRRPRSRPSPRRVSIGRFIKRVDEPVPSLLDEAAGGIPFDVRLDDFLAGYTFLAGALLSHQSVRDTEYWPEWGPFQRTGQDEAGCMRRVLGRARSMGPPRHDASWCGACSASDI